MSEAWQMFFCAACQRERPISERQRTGKRALARCIRCTKKTRFDPAAKRAPADYDFYESQPIPDEVLDAYRESQG